MIKYYCDKCKKPVDSPCQRTLIKGGSPAHTDGLYAIRVIWEFDLCEECTKEIDEFSNFKDKPCTNSQ